ncbi:MAG: cytochrome c biogenesis protein CcsA [Deltaproteobacteria bacterium]|nr:cytochrome c biogenesis protein CcsA [Deltaproteobacteria bacterium]MCB9788188.1 cytochrome c biogenesis protein CcsA [Deltaproteobacteria bacterium]
MTSNLLTAAAASFGLAAASFMAWLVRYDERWRARGAWATFLGTLLLLGATVVELLVAVTPALPLGPRVLLLLIFGVCAVFLTSRLRRDLPLAGPVVAPLAASITFALAVKATRGSLPDSTTLMGAVTALHIGATLLGFLLFAPAYVFSVLFLDQEYRLRTKTRGSALLPSLLGSEQLAWRLVFVGFPLYSVGVLLGFVWQERAGPVSGWRPEHFLAAVSWGLYAYLTARRLRTGWRGRRAALVMQVAFVVTLAAVLLYVMR